MTLYGMTRSGILLAPRWSQTRKFFMAWGSCARGSSDDCDLIASVRACTDLIAPALTDSGSGREAATKSAPALAAGALRCGSPGESSLRSAAAKPQGERAIPIEFPLIS